ncbi:GFA family protein [Pseudoroseomonas globiformis]|uniref:GFA family protein n=1 Tax=Teichococcus globiformis TaxID=2307229 RepID=A0ABV7FXI9_9PROT
MLRLGGCQCGAVRFSSEDAAPTLYVCHCRECRKQSASAFGMSLRVNRSGFALLRGRPRCWSRGAASGRRLFCLFCPDCGTRLWHQRSADSPWVTLKAGALDEPVDLSGAIHIWTESRWPGLAIPDSAPSFPREPPE